MYPTTFDSCVNSPATSNSGALTNSFYYVFPTPLNQFCLNKTFVANQCQASCLFLYVDINRYQILKEL